MSSPIAPSRPSAVVSAVSQASLAVGRLDGALRTSPDAIVRRLRQMADDDPPGAGEEGERDALRIGLAACEGSGDLVRALLDGATDSEAVARCQRVAAVADRAEQCVRSACRMVDEHRRVVASRAFGRYGSAMLDLLVDQPAITVHDGVERLGASPTTIGALLDRFAELGIVEEVTGRRRGRVFRYRPFLDLFEAVVRPRAGTGGRQNGAMADGAMSLADWVPAVAERIFEQSNVKRVVVFGSVARGDDRSDSDLDLLVVLDHVVNAHDDAVGLLMRLRDIPIPVDVIVTDDDRLQVQSRVPGVIRVALREGRVIERAA